MVKVLFIAKIKDLNPEYEAMNETLSRMAEQAPGFVSVTSEVIDDVEITISTWESQEAVDAWARDPVHITAKKQALKWYHWVKGIHIKN